ncbi:MAG: hypothetical protein ACBZ72_00480 [Candidatus Bathyarchaeia archaeon]
MTTLASFALTTFPWSLLLALTPRVVLGMSEKGYENGYVKCSECRNLESYWKNGALVFYMCRLRPVAMKKQDNSWRRCRFFIHTNDSPIERQNQIK